MAREGKEERLKKKRREKRAETHVSLLVGAVAPLGDDAAAFVDEHAADGDLLALECGGGLEGEKLTKGRGRGERRSGPRILK